MKQEEGGKPRDEINTVLSMVVEDTIRPLPFIPRVIERFPFEGLNGREAQTHLTICGKVIIATERADNPGGSITNAAESLWATVRGCFGQDVIAIEHYPNDRGFPEDWDLVTMVDGEAKWSPLSRETLATLIANPATELDDEIETDVEDSDCAEEGHVFLPGDELALAGAIDSYVTRTPPHPFDGDEV